MRSKRSGVTLVEVIVVVSVLATLIFLLIPAVQSVRENARRGQCQNNLRQQALAVQHFESTHRLYPALYNGTFLPQPESALDEFHFHSWRSAILSELEESAVSGMLNWKLPASDPANQPAVNREIAVLICPSTANFTPKVPDILRYNNGKIPVEKIGTAARSDYEAIGGVRVTAQSVSPELLGDMKFGVWGEPRYKPGTGYPISYRKARASDVSDGLSKTLLLAERGGRPDIFERDKSPDPYPWRGRKLEEGIDYTQAAWGISTHIAWLVFADTQTVNQTNATGIYGFHPSGANAALADGSVQFLVESTDTKVLSAMATRAGGD